MSENQKPEEPATEPVPDLVPKEHHKPNEKASGSRLARFKSWYAERKQWTVPVSVLLFIILLAAVPFTRYNLAGLVVKHDLTIKVMDATAHTPVSGATLSLGPQNVQTDSNGSATLHYVKAGHHKIVISKKYYQERTVDALSPVFGRANSPSFELTATGRQVKVTVTNLINKSPLADVTIKVADISAKTDQQGTALLVLPAGIAEQKAELTAEGFNGADATIKINDNDAKANNFNLTPSGKVYFLSKLSGKIDVVKTNLDGTDRQTVLAGTGNEDDRNTVLLASRDWKYLALLSRRAGNNPSLYLINTADDSDTVMDSGSVDFNLAGWTGDNFVYTIAHNDMALWQSGRQVLKSYNAPTKKSQNLDQNTASGSSYYDNVTQSIDSVYEYNGQIFYVKSWNSGINVTDALDNQQATFNVVKPDGTGKKTIRSFAGTSGTHPSFLGLDSVIERPGKINFRFNDGTATHFYTFSDGQVKDSSTLTDQNFFSSNNPTYLLSPSGNNTFWSEPRDGKNTLFVGDEDGQNSKQIATLSDYNTYGWYTDDYLLVSKNDSELYIMDNAGKQTPVKISDYHKPALTFAGYGGGYGGI